MSEITSLVNKVREKQPLVHNITNQVVINYTANGLYAIGAAPVMANAVEEAADMANNADALLLNIGTLTTVQVDAMILAGKAANQKGIPVVFDPVGVGATPYRSAMAKKILDNVQVSVVRGNAAEVGLLAGLKAVMRGVDAEAQGDHQAVALQATKQLGIPVIVTGEHDVITDGSKVFVIENGHPLLTKVTGTGCLLSSVVAAFLAAHENVLEACAGAVGFYGVAAEVAASHTSAPGTFQVAFLDALYHVNSDVVTDTIKLTERFIEEVETK
ncbi:hydroxyethylthiazole kinase [Aquibacillus koreensis]|uniref:Hydroxyethylthiazole kinase n=2 Tax=Aquibacillus koreensis TaxID=279446 RepID=A0A9X3WNJ6_9BACI|nr:hydroxyethylthiazole kinase [Aquibacillus koreensis]MCT2536206.1 hydroxyethylthiazole kinase [Aquibacillus koreensis]MDC3422130.1 hydroxyethylthiazole kinase [Aquibacillus koreensis]